VIEPRTRRPGAIQFGAPGVVAIGKMGADIEKSCAWSSRADAF
jgi:hypothetical protein